MATWTREEVSYCSCAALSYIHAHCPCQQCNGKAVSRSMEYRHWQVALLLTGVRTPATSCELITPPGVEAIATSVAQNPVEDGVDQDTSGPGVDEITTSVRTSSSTDRMAVADSDLSEPNTFGEDVGSDIVVAILKAFNLMEKMGGSQKNLLDIVAFGHDLYCKGNSETLSKWPTSWTACMRILKDAGYKEPVAYYVCLSKNHLNLWSLLHNPTDTCQYCQKPGTIEYHYLRLTDKVKRWCACESFCEKMTAHWRHRESWLNGSGGESLGEIWDGRRFAELSWFWNPEEQWLLPVRCTFCSAVVSAEVISSSSEYDSHHTSTIVIECPHCYTQFDHTPQYASGDPRNIALIGHWDGWQPFSTSVKHSCGSIEVQIANMSKLDRSKTDEVYVCGFVPSYMLPTKMPWSIDPFLHPLITEIEGAFIDGIQVDYKGRVAGIEPGPSVIRCLILCWTGDHPAQCEVGKFLSSGGVHACRRDKLEGVLSSSSTQYYYGDFRRHFRYPWPDRSVYDSVEDMNKVDEEDRVTVRRKLASATGFTGLSILHRLHYLYKFDVLKDLVFDAMHTLLLVNVKRHLERYKDNGFLNECVEKRLNAMPWTAELKDGRVPQGITRRMGFWKAEEYQKFTFPASEYVLGGILPDREYHAWILLVRITELVFSCGRSGWTFESLELLKKLIWRHNIITEEIEGLNCCVISLHNLVHFTQDIERFSSPDNYWCFVFERAIHTYLDRSSNKKHLELTFAKAESRRELLKFLPHQPVSAGCEHHNYPDGCQQLPLQSKSIVQVHKCFGHLRTEHPILVGGKKLITVQTTEIQDMIPIELDSSEVVAISCRSILLLHHGVSGTLYRTGEHILVSDGDEQQEIIQATTFFSVHVRDQYCTFVKGELFLHPTEKPTHIYSSNPIVVPTSKLVVFLATKVLRKVMLYPDPENIDSPTCYVVIDFQRPELPIAAKDVIVPYYPVVGDMVQVRGDNDDIWHAHIHSVDDKTRTCQIHFYVQATSFPGKYVRESVGRAAMERIVWDSILHCATGYWEGNHWRNM